jgi:hypothetical protein
MYLKLDKWKIKMMMMMMILHKVMSFKNSLLGYGTALLRNMVTTV